MRTGHKGELPSRHQIPDIDARDTSRSGSAQAALGDLLRVCNRLADRWTQEDQESLTRRVARWGNTSAAGKTDALTADTGTAQKLLRSLCKACQTQRAGAMAGTLQLLTSELATLIRSMPTPVVERWDAELLEQLVRTLNECDWSAASSQTSREISEILIARRDPGVNDFSILLMVGSKLFNESKGIARQLKERRTHPTKFSALVNNRQRMLEQLRTRGWPEGAPDALKVKDIAGGALAVRGLLKSGLAAHFPEKSNQVVMAWLELLLAGSQYLGPVDIASALTSIEAVVKDKTTALRENPEVKAQLEKALPVLLQLTCSKDFWTNAKPQEITNALNCIKAVVQDETTKLRENPKVKPQLEKALLVLLQLTCSNDFRTNAEPQHIANALNCIKAVIEDETTKLRENPKVRAQLEKALLVLLQLTCSPNFGEKEDPQAIANALNCIKAVIEDETTKLREDSEVKAQLENALPVLLQLTCLLNVGEKADPRHIANALNCIKAVVEDDATGLRDHDAVQAQLGQALPVLLRATCTNAFRVEADSQAVANVLFVLHVLQGRSQPFVATHAQALADSARAMLALACLGRVDAMHPIHRCQLRIALRSLTEQEVLKAGDHAVQVMMRALYQRMSEQGPQVEGLKPNALGNRIWLCAQLHASGLMSSEDFDGLAPVFASQVSRMLALPAGQTKADVAARLWLLESAARLHGKLVRSSPDEAAMLDEAVLKAAQAMDWPWVAELQLRTQMGDCCFALTRVMDRLRTNDARRPPWEAAIVSAARALAPLISDGEVKFTEANVILRFVPEAEWTSLRIPAMGLARQREIVYAAWKSLKNNPVPMTSSKPIELPVLRDNGRPVLKDGKPKSLTYESLVHQELFGDQFTPLLVEIPKYVRPGTVPLVVKHNGRLYRTELFRGSKNKPEEGELPQLICVPVESGEFFANWWVTSKESRTYAQRAFLNGQVGKAQAANDKAAQSQGAGGLKGRFGVAVVPDDKAAQFVPKGPSQHLRVRDGCGFIKRSLAEQLVGRKQLAKQLELACVNGKPSDKGLSGQALHHYPVRPEQAKAIAQEFLGHAKRQLMQPLKVSRIPPEPATLAHANAMGRAPIFHRKAVPSADQKLRLPDTPEWRKRAAEGVIVTRPPQDTENLLFVPRGDIEFVPPTLVLQHSLTGYRKVPREGDGLLQEKAREFHERQQEMGKQQGIEVPENEEWLQSLFFKGQLVIVDDDDWPENFSKQQIVVSAKDLKTSNLMDSLDTKKKMQNPQEISTFKMRGCLAFKQLNVGVAVPEKMQADLGGDYDGDDLGILSAAEFPELTKLVIERQPHKRRNAKMPKSFTLARQGEWDVTKIEQILIGLTGKSAVASRAYYAAPQALVDPLYQDEDFLQGEIVQDLMELVAGDDPWHVKAGWKDDVDLANHVHARLLLERELELLEKAGTDLEKTDLPVSLLVERCKDYMKKLQEHGQVAWGKGLEKNLKAAKAEWAFAAGDDERAGDPSAGTSLEELRDAYAEVLLAMREHTRTQRGLPAAITMAIMDWYLEGLTPRLAADATVLSLSPVSSIDDAARALRQEGELRLEASPDLHEELPDPMVVDASAGQSSASNKQRAVRQADLDWVNQIRTTSMPPELLLNPASRDAGDPADDLRDLDEELPEEDLGRVMGIADVDDLPGWVIRTSDELAALKASADRDALDKLVGQATARLIGLGDDAQSRTALQGFEGFLLESEHSQDELAPAIAQRLWEAVPQAVRAAALEKAQRAGTVLNRLLPEANPAARKLVFAQPGVVAALCKWEEQLAYTTGRSVRMGQIKDIVEFTPAVGQIDMNDLGLLCTAIDKAGPDTAAHLGASALAARLSTSPPAAPELVELIAAVHADVVGHGTILGAKTNKALKDALTSHATGPMAADLAKALAEPKEVARCSEFLAGLLNRQPSARWTPLADPGVFQLMLRCEPFVKFKRRGESIEFDVPSCAKLAADDFQALIALLKPLAPKAAAALHQTREPAAPSQEKPTTPNEPKRKREGLPQNPKRRPDAPRPSTWRALQTLVSGFGPRMSGENRRQLVEAAKHAITSMGSVDGTSVRDVLDLAGCPAADAKKLCTALAELAESEGDVFNVRLPFAPPASVQCVPLEGFDDAWTITGRVDDSMQRRDDPPALDPPHQGVDTLLTDARARATHMQRCEALVREISSGDIYDEKTGKALRGIAVVFRFRSDLSPAQRDRMEELRRDVRRHIEALLRQFTQTPLQQDKVARVREALQACVECNALEPGNAALVLAESHLAALPV